MVGAKLLALRAYADPGVDHNAVVAGGDDSDDLVLMVGRCLILLAQVQA